MNMNKKVLLILPLFLGLVACDNGETPTSESAPVSVETSSETSVEVSSSEASSSSSVSIELPDFEAMLKKDNHTFYSQRASFRMNVGNTNIYSATTRKEVNLTDMIDHRYAYISEMPDLSNPTSTLVTTTDIYYTPTRTYVRGQDGKYLLTEEANEIKIFTLDYDFSQVSNFTVTAGSATYCRFTGEVEDSKISAFLGIDASDITGLSMDGQIISDGQFLQDLNIRYTKAGEYSCTLELDFTNFDANLTLPA